MTVKEAIEIRERAKELGLERCCDECREALQRLEKLGYVSGFAVLPKVENPTYPQGEREGTVGLGNEEAVRSLRRHISRAALTTRGRVA